MTTLLGFAAALAIILMAGTGTALLLAGRRLSPWECIALPWLLGTAVTSLVLWLGGLVVHGIVLQLLTTAVAVSLGVAGWKRHRGFAASSDRLARFDKWDTAGLILFGIEVAVLVGLALQHTLGWDGISVWELKARYAFLNGGDLPIAYFSDAARRFSHPEYPLLLPLTETWFYLWMGVPDQFWIKLIFPLWSIALFAVLFLSGLE
jgi:hypothetical protein